MSVIEGKVWGSTEPILQSAAGDHDIEEEDYVMVTNLSCPTCESIVYVYYPKEKEDA